ncbi:L-arabinose 1-dehydrogenase (NAD(P)(+)) [Sphingomonas sp. S2M10]|uniref:Gfo/Idh/MocA family protein n=1 Tax=Sphingomonas sp. S2M10 TaxID=2705010 RepID=UPI00145670C1|nr:Gfo/Idh/MocA family oxidoreductase [Sphingomonas sp. S2M10]NLS27538.1 L-arabinose 1-dehydrogenase (NAD(P)(+)) [Sphingomonas sp. S2M10]
MSERIRLGLVGIGKIARDQHLPALAGEDRFDLVATASRHASVDGVPSHKDVESLIAGGHALDAVSLCTPPEGRYDQARLAIEAGLNVMLEKPPAATLTEIFDLAERARAKGVTLFTTWHSREAAGVEPAQQWLAGKNISAVRITWREDIRRWHPGQEWILAPGGFGVFDPGINALSIVTKILPDALLLDEAWMEVPEGRASPLRAKLHMRCAGAPVTADFDFLQTGPQTWDIEVDTDAGTLSLGMGGSVLQLPGEDAHKAPDREYARLYARFAALVAAKQSDVDVRPLQLVADAFLVGERAIGEPFAF